MSTLIVIGAVALISAVCLYVAYRRGVIDGRAAGLTEQDFRTLSRALDEVPSAWRTPGLEEWAKGIEAYRKKPNS